MIYFIRCPNTELIKIGCTTRKPEDRFREIQAGSATRLLLIGVIDGDLKDEHNLHARFALSRVHGEWFRRTPEMDVFIIRNVTPIPVAMLPEDADWYQKAKSIQSPEFHKAMNDWVNGLCDRILTGKVCLPSPRASEN